MKIFKKSHIALVSAVTIGGLTQGLQAMPMFSTQTGADCSTCHTQQMPRLNKFGRKFAASGMTISQKILDDNASFTSGMDINPSMLIKSKYNKTYDKPNGKGIIDTEDGSTNEGEFSAIRMATIYVGGRVSENIGAILKFGHRKEEGESIEGKAVYAHALDDTAYIGAVFYSTSGLGPFAGMEFYNTGLYKPLRMFDMKIYNNSTQKEKIGAEAATGLQVYYDKDGLFDENDHFFITAGMYVPAQDGLYYDMGDNLLPFARIAYEYMYNDFNFIFGGFIIKGGDIVASTAPLSIKRETYGIDLQIEGTIMEREVTLAATKVFKNDVIYTGINSGLDNISEDVFDEGFSVQAAVSVTEAFIAKASYMNYNDKNEYLKYDSKDRPKYETDKINAKDLDYAIGVGLDYGFTLYVPMKLTVEYAWMKPTRDDISNYQDFMVTLTLPF
ncbi:hypothetical protein MNB_SV-5-166 [hydrothermal vent metagenome]|uniref:Cytochrome c domain-containing protein n=1 Tax=hydrothermal vent metagenome TaxID=652676 RepID=A0A1W1ECN4_9ZZZZ